LIGKGIILGEADKAAAIDDTRYMPDESYIGIRERINSGLPLP